MAFSGASNTALAPLGGTGCFRIGEDGRLFLTAKSEHYHAPLGHRFAGYRLIEYAHRMGIPNATHNNTRGYIVRLLEGELIRTANGIPRDDNGWLGKTESKYGQMLNRVLNLQTGSLAAEAAIKMMLGRFYEIEDGLAPPKYKGRVPVLVVLGDDNGELYANYHGTTIFAQMMRGMWPGVREMIDAAGGLKLIAVRPNRLDDVEKVFDRYEDGLYKIAGFSHEIVMMNYGARLLSKSFLQACYRLCNEHDVPTFVDEIQSGLWSPELYMFREYEINPDMVAIGKGFSGGESSASRILFNGQFDYLPQFGALVTNGQEELSALAYLITMEWAWQNREVTQKVGDYYQSRLNDLVARHGGILEKIEGCRHMAGLRFHDLATAHQFVQVLVESGIDISVQTYKADCPATALTKLPLIAGYEVVDFLVDSMAAALKEVETGGEKRQGMDVARDHAT